MDGTGRRDYDEVMSYQPNPFVNPNQRGVELPPGCKDLIDVRRLPQSRTPLRDGAGSVGDMGDYFGVLAEWKSTGWSLVILNMERSTLLIVSHLVDGYVLRIPADALTHFAMEAAKELFGEDVLGRREDGHPNIIPVPLPRFWGDAAQPVIDLLIRG